MLEYKKDTWKAVVSLAPTLVLMAIFIFWPIINAVRLSFMNGYAIVFDTAGHTFKLGVENYVTIFKDPIFWTALRNTGIMVIISVPLTIVIGLLIAVALNSIKKLQGVFQTIFFLPYVTNTIALGLVFSTLFNQKYGLINKLLNDDTIFWINGIGEPNYWRAILVLTLYTVWNGLAFKIIVFLSGLQSIDKQYYQAAQIDSASRWTTFRRITVPLLSPMILYITITSFIGAFKGYSSVVSIFNTTTSTGPGMGPAADTNLLITVVGYIYNTMYTSLMPIGKAASASIILFIIIMLITLVQMQVSKKRVHY